MLENEKLVEDMTRRARTVAESIRRPGGKDSKAGKMLYEMATALTLAQARIRELETALAARSAEPVAWREMDDGWIYYDRDRNPELVDHIEKHQKVHHGVSVFPLYAHPAPEAPDV